jgi:hypothetical protein
MVLELMKHYSQNLFIKKYQVYLMYSYLLCGSCHSDTEHKALWLKCSFAERLDQNIRVFNIAKFKELWVLCI